jgi:integration host factor subunit beta
MASTGNANNPSDRNVTKRHLVDEITRRTSLSRGDVQTVVQGVLDELIGAIGQGKRVEIRDFGVFEVKARAARTAQNPKTLEPVSVPPKLAVRFKPGRLMKAALDAGVGGGDAEVIGPAESVAPVDPTLNGHAREEGEPPIVEVPRRTRVPAGVRG